MRLLTIVLAVIVLALATLAITQHRTISVLRIDLAEKEAVVIDLNSRAVAWSKKWTEVSDQLMTARGQVTILQSKLEAQAPRN